MSHQLALIHTVTGLLPVFAELTRRHLPHWEIFNLVDESLLKETVRRGRLTPDTARRVAGHVWSAVDAGAEAVMVTCSSIGPAVDAVRPLCPVPLFRVDEAMADEAVATGARIGVLGTLRTTLGPTCELVGRRAAALGRKVTIQAALCEGAFEALVGGDQALHDALVADELRRVAHVVDVILLAQASMARVLESLDQQELKVPVFASPELGVLRLKAILPNC